MPQTVAERMARYRARQRAAGLVHLSVAVPAGDAALVTAFAAERRALHGRNKPVAGARWFSGLSIVAPTPAPPSAPTAPGPVRRAETLADAMLARIVRQGWPIGQPLGSEAGLTREHGVSRAVVRQTIRLLEHQGVARMRRGTGGGLVVSRPDAEATVRAVGVWLEYEAITAGDIMHTRRTLELAALALAVQRLDDVGVARLRALLTLEAPLDGSASRDDLQRLHLTLAELSGDPALRLFIAIVLRLTDAHSSFSKRPRVDRDAVVVRIKRLHRDIALAVIRRDAPAAAAKLSRYLDGLRDWML